MSYLARIAAVFGLVVLAACASAPAPVGANVAAWSLDGVAVRFGPDVARTASGTEFGSNFVWDGLNGGNRKKQVVAMFRNAAAEVGRAAMTGSQPVRMNITVNYFHALTDSARLWCCGEHRILADLQVVDAGSGAVLASGENVYLGRVALGGVPGLIAEAAGRDQATRVREGIANGIRAWLTGQ